MHYSCELKEVEFFAHHGLYKEEQHIGGKFIVSVLVTQDRNDNDPLSNLNELVNYEALYQLVFAIMKTKEELIEVVAKKIMDEVYQLYPTSTLVKVSITKLNPAGLFKSGAAHVTLER